MRSSLKFVGAVIELLDLLAIIFAIVHPSKKTKSASNATAATRASSSTMACDGIIEPNTISDHLGDWSTPPRPTTIDVSMGYSILVSAEAAGSLDTDASGRGDVVYDIASSTGVTMEDMKVSKSADRSGSLDYTDGSGIETADGGCKFVFADAGTYTNANANDANTNGYDSTDANYASISPADGLTLEVVVS